LRSVDAFRGGEAFTTTTLIAGHGADRHRARSGRLVPVIVAAVAPTVTTVTAVATVCWCR
jgi:hypothetical protein